MSRKNPSFDRYHILTGEDEPLGVDRVRLNFRKLTYIEIVATERGVEVRTCGDDQLVVVPDCSNVIRVELRERK